ncbi:MAG: response regulator transcription factor [Bifidobacterium psychraerophilum]|uniref:response regulator transcription factor n=1 Tax=Bifidobacterium psychraerophilum TaxID=218140 RepID=UPI0039E78A5C
MARILIVEDDEALASVTRQALGFEGYCVDVAANGVEALDRLSRCQYELMLLDRDLPVLHGDEVIRAVVSLKIPVNTLMLTAAASLNDKVQGLDLGADDYLPKPFAYPELLARIRALLRRNGTGENTMLIYGRLSVDTVRHLAYADDKPLSLAPKEYGVLEELLHAEGGYVSTETLLESLWDDPGNERHDVVKTTVYSLRRRLPDPTLIASSRGMGYRLP